MCSVLKLHRRTQTPITIFSMRPLTVLAFLAFTAAVWVQSASQTRGPKSTTVPFKLDHDRIVINVSFSLPDRSTQTVRAWVDNGTPDLCMSRRLATLLNLKVTCDDKTCLTTPPPEMIVGDMSIPLTSIKEAQVPLKPVAAAGIIAPGISAEINIPASVLRNYDVLVDIPEGTFTLAQPGEIKFQGVSSKVEISRENGLIEVPGEIENKKCNLALDLGSSISFLSDEHFAKLAAAHPDWPQMTGAVGPANMWGSGDEPDWKLMRLDRLQFGPLHLAGIAMVELPKGWQEFFEKRAGIPTAGSIGAEALLNYRVGLDYAHSTVYFDIGRLVNIPDFDVIGLILRAEDDGRFSVIGVANLANKTSVPGVQPGDHLIAVDGNPIAHFTMGQVWSLLQGSPGQQKQLTLERAGREFTVMAEAQHFLEQSEEAEPRKDGSRKKKSD